MRRGGDDLTISLKKKEKIDYFRRYSKKLRSAYHITKKRVCNEGETTGSLISGYLHCESNQGAFRSELSEEVASNLSKSVVSLSLLDGDVVLFECSGIVASCKGDVTKLLTSASLLKAFIDKREDHDNMKVEVRHEDNVVIGLLREYNLGHNIAAVIVEKLLDLRAVPISKIFKFQPPIKVVAVGRDISGKLMATRGLLIGDSSGSYNYHLKLSTCKISEVCEGGPVFSFDGNFLGMNLSFNTEGTSFVPADRVYEQFVRCITVHEVKLAERIKFLKTVSLSVEIAEFYRVHKDVPNKDQFGDLELESLGYPEPPKSMLNDGMMLVNTFEESYGDICGKGVWNELSETVASNICENIVALASFNGEKLFFACTGFFIEWNEGATILTSANLLRDSGHLNKIVENLRIEVLLPNKQYTEGTIQHYNLHYNVALISVKDYCACRPAKIQDQRHFDRRVYLQIWQINGYKRATVLHDDKRFPLPIS